MSLASIKQKEAKGRKNALPKLRTVLANPYKQHSPVLPDHELEAFRDILQKAISESDRPQNTFACHTRIQLGLKSCLRAINACRFSCVFISLSLRPAHLVRLIATNANVKVPTAPIYAQPKLEELTAKLFGVRALAMVLPLEPENISLNLAEWVAARKRPAPKKNVNPCAIAKPNKKLKEKVQLQTQKFVVEAAAPKAAPVPVVEKQWSGDYISCSNDVAVVKLDQFDVQAESQQLQQALDSLAKKALSETNPASKSTKPPTNTLMPERMEVEETTEMNYLLPADAYRALTVQQIQQNPNKKPKKERNKKQKQQNKTK